MKCQKIDYLKCLNLLRKLTIKTNQYMLIESYKAKNH